VAPVAALQSEWSLWERDVEAEIAPTARELGVAFVPYSPLGRGFLTGQVPRAEELPPSDYRHHDPRYQGANYDANLAAVSVVKQVAADHQANPAQVAIAWLLAKGDDVVPIPGCKRRATLNDTAGATKLSLSAADIAALNAALPQTSGARYGSKAALAMTRL
jgi:aryl-alcohol dehydrogenase-like predicted oxidoreductase